MDVIKNKHVYDIYKQQMATAQRDKAEETYSVLLKESSDRNMRWDFNELLTNRIAKIVKAVNKRQELRKNEQKIIEWEEQIFMKLLLVSPPRARVGRPTKRLGENIECRSANKRLDPILDNLKKISEEQNIKTKDLLIALTKRHREKYSAEYECENEKEKIDMPVTAACNIIYNINFSLNQFQELRMILLDYNFHLPTRDSVDSYKKTLLPPIESSDTKVHCLLPEMIKQTVSSLLEIEEVAGDPSSVLVTAKFGLDGSGQHAIRHQKTSIQDNNDYNNNNYIGAFWCPLSIKVNEKMVWHNHLPNSTLFARPVCLMKGKERHENVETHFKPFMDTLHQMETQSLPVITNHDNGTKQCLHNMNVTTELSMIDGKMANIIQGDSGAFCHYCNITRKEANILERIEQGFVIKKTAEDALRIWQALESGELSYNDKGRAGQVRKPLNNRPMQYYGITHQKLRLLDHMEKLLYHLVSGQTHTWSETEYRVADASRLAKKEVMDNIRHTCGFLIDTPTSNGGNTNTQGISDRFFSPRNREDICSNIRKESDRVAYSTLLQKVNMVLAVTQQVDMSKIAIPEKVREITLDLMIFHKRSFPWAMLSPTFHSMCAHDWELFRLSQGQPIGIFSEQGSEAWNKSIRAFKSGPGARARQTSIHENTLDIFQRMMIMTHPLIATSKRQLQCSRCGKIGHTIRSCPARLTTVIDFETTIVNDCFFRYQHEE